MADQAIIGLTTVKINGIYRVDVRNIRWSIKRASPEVVTAGGVRVARGAEIPSGTIDEVIPRDKIFDWRSLKAFSMEVLDQDTRSVVVASFEGIEWTGIDGSTNLDGAQTGKTIAWHGTGVVSA